MTHYTVVVFDSGERVHDLMAKYDENIQVPEYLVGLVSDEDKKRFINYYTENDKEATQEQKEERKRWGMDKLLKEFGESWNGNCWRYNEKGELEEWSIYNPDSKYDYYQVYSHTLPDFIPFAFVTPDGVWHEKGKMGWWAITSGEISDRKWERIWRTELHKYEGKVSILDCHI